MRCRAKKLGRRCAYGPNHTDLGEYSVLNHKAKDGSEWISTESDPVSPAEEALMNIQDAADLAMYLVDSSPAKTPYCLGVLVARIEFALVEYERIESARRLQEPRG